MQTNKMRKYYFAVLGEVGIAYNLNKEDLHELFKVGYKIKSTTNLDYDGWYEYIENILYFIAEIYGLYFDIDYYKYDGISFVMLPECILFNKSIAI